MWKFAALVALLSLPSVARAGDAAAGRSIYVAKCQACHGPAGKGDGPAAAALPSPPADLSAPAFWAAMTDDKLAATITNGKPGGTMQPFAMNKQQLGDLVAYLHTLAPG